VVLALQGRIVDPAFGVAIGFPQLGAADGITMILVAIGVTLVSAWDILDAFRRARIARSAAITG
jgi:hypothetical protein